MSYHHEPPMLGHYESHKNVGRALEGAVAGDLTIREDNQARTCIIKFMVRKLLGFFFRSFDVEQRQQIKSALWYNE